MTKSKRIHFGELRKSIAGLAPKVCLLLLSMLFCSCYGMKWYIKDIEPTDLDLDGFSLYPIFGNDILTCSPEEKRARLKKDIVPMDRLKDDDVFYYLICHDNAVHPDVARFANMRCPIPPGSTGKIMKQGYWNSYPIFQVPARLRSGYWIRITTPDGTSFYALSLNDDFVQNM